MISNAARFEATSAARGSRRTASLSAFTAAGRLADGLEHEREVRPCFREFGIDVERSADALCGGGTLTGLVQHDARIVQRLRMTRLGLEDRVVAMERLAELALAVHGERALELLLEFHAAGGEKDARV